MEQKRCQVCGMDAGDTPICADHLGVIYHFCSPQCRDNFQARPKLYLGEQSPVRRGLQVIKRRVFRLDQPLAGIKLECLVEALNRLMSVHHVRVEGDRLFIAYNLLEINAVQIEAALEQAGVAVSSSWLERLKRSWIHYTEENELDNLATGEAACCNKPPAKG